MNSSQNRLIRKFQIEKEIKETSKAERLFKLANDFIIEVNENGKRLWCNKKIHASLRKISHLNLICCAEGKSIKMWNTAKANSIKSFSGHSNWIECLACTSDDLILSGSDDRTIKLWSVNANTCIR